MDAVHLPLSPITICIILLYRSSRITLTLSLHAYMLTSLSYEVCIYPEPLVYL